MPQPTNIRKQVEQLQEKAAALASFGPAFDDIRRRMEEYADDLEKTDITTELDAIERAGADELAGIAAEFGDVLDDMAEEQQVMEREEAEENKKFGEMPSMQESEPGAEKTQEE